MPVLLLLSAAPAMVTRTAFDVQWDVPLRQQIGGAPSKDLIQRNGLVNPDHGIGGR